MIGSEGCRLPIEWRLEVAEAAGQIEAFRELCRDVRGGTFSNYPFKAFTQ